jgi:hypothetical protein
MLATDHEGEMILGIYSSEEAATDALEAFFLAHQPSDSELLEILVANPNLEDSLRDKCAEMLDDLE